MLLTTAPKAQHLRFTVRTTFDTARAEALFASALQPSDRPSPAQVRAAITSTLRQRGIRGCAAHLAGEFGDDPEAAAGRMRWAIAVTQAI
ncbi:hypothetical protein AB0J83_00465 [Actinoplanes sp. NPDC049596]|uniref:hypothetical protein n=1 Tax=unclassified Actinoplanes TaxID=2626549 RepID=UPI00342DCFF8